MPNTETDTNTPEYEWRGEYAAEMMREKNPPDFACYSQSVRAASLALDVLGRE